MTENSLTIRIVVDGITEADQDVLLTSIKLDLSKVTAKVPPVFEVGRATRETVVCKTP